MFVEFTGTSSTMGWCEYVGIVSLDSRSSSSHNSSTSCAIRFASSNVRPNVTQPGNEGNETL